MCHEIQMVGADPVIKLKLFKWLFVIRVKIGIHDEYLRGFWTVYGSGFTSAVYLRYI